MHRDPPRPSAGAGAVQSPLNTPSSTVQIRRNAQESAPGSFSTYSCCRCSEVGVSPLRPVPFDISQASVHKSCLLTLCVDLILMHGNVYPFPLGLTATRSPAC